MLPADLKEAEMQLNQIKLNVHESQRAAQEAEKRKNDLVMYLAHDLKNSANLSYRLSYSAER